VHIKKRGRAPKRGFIRYLEGSGENNIKNEAIM